MGRAAVLVCGEHDFTSFAATDPDRLERDSSSEGPGNNVRCLYTSQWALEAENDLLIYRVRGTGFLHHMVRNLVGTFLEVGRGDLRETEVPAF